MLGRALIALLLLSPPLSQGQPLTATQPISGAQRGGMCFTNHSRMKDTEVPWNCEHIGRVTIRQIYERGFRVVGYYSGDLSEKVMQWPILIIEEQRK